MKLGALALVCSLCAGCASTRMFSGKPPGEAAPGYDSRWHSALFAGALPLHTYQLSQICRDGWSEVKLEADPFTFFATLGTLLIYTPSRLTVVCAAKSSERPTLRAYPPPVIE
ncbi:MAG: hypothetical protein QM756_26440 [Polyangiaceae bacterium]